MRNSRVTLGLLFLTMVAGPCLYSSTREPWKTILVVLGAGTCLVRVAEYLWAGRLPRIPFLLGGSAGFLLLQGWAIAANPEGTYVPYLHVILPVAKACPWVPGTADAGMSVDTMRWVTVVMGLSVVSCDLFLPDQERERLVLWMAVVGGVVSLVGIGGRLFRDPFLVWLWRRNEIGTEFGFFRYHGAAGAFLNVVWPPCFAQLLRHLGKPGGWLGRAFWSCTWLILVVGLLVNASMGSLVIAAVLWMGWGLYPIIARLCQCHGERLILGRGFSWIVYGASLGLVLGIGLLVSPGIGDLAWKRHQSLWDPGRVAAWRACLFLVRKAGLWGFGPGTFEAVFGLIKFGRLGSLAGFRWETAHEDYLQTIIEWGWVGFIVWVVWYAGGLVGWVHRFLRSGSKVCWGIILSLFGVSIHAFFDFPFQIPAIQLYIALLLGAGWSFFKEGKSHHYFVSNGSFSASGVSCLRAIHSNKENTLG
ncbi:O-antigen ligase family protein [Candidatus Methylacidithermus pantelleriae]|uniref:O-antigen ligase family protein n=1 Tax=Candidatus Methylacidithermus pantelleriae TaxID=2744239 RepID=UPI001BD2A100|nr:hypothetical protein [Candidatus Methylacidithermus pantelleriae]